MFGDLARAFREAVDNFRAELDRDRVPETVDELLRGMRREVVEARTHALRLEEDIRGALRRAKREEEEAATCRRREELAREIGDDETAEVARDFAERHEKRQRVLERKALALREELELRREEMREMLERLHEAGTLRDGLTASVGRTRARETLGEVDALFDDLDRMEERIGDVERRIRAEEELDEEL